jgi:seryl-tRNA synthetase
LDLFLQAKQDATELQDKTKAMKASIAELEEKEKQIIADRDAALVPMGNVVHDSVPVSDNEVRYMLNIKAGSVPQHEVLTLHLTADSAAGA